MEDFNSHTPREVWHNLIYGERSNGKFQLTHPSRGVAFFKPYLDTQLFHFNSHTPREVWPPSPTPTVNASIISTHTPLARCGRNHFFYIGMYQISTHTPLARCGHTPPILKLSCQFQLTHPSRGVAALRARSDLHVGISTHTPLARCGLQVQAVLFVLAYFNSHTPREVWQWRVCISLYNWGFQLTHPSRGVAFTSRLTSPVCVISTHTPLARCGLPRHRIFTAARNISTHTPLARCGPLIASNVVSVKNFNSHTPREVWRDCLCDLRHGSHISTHTPLARCGIWEISAILTLHRISTHTPLARCGIPNTSSVKSSNLFQLTHPSRGVARSRPRHPGCLSDFNSHTPREVWRRRELYY